MALPFISPLLLTMTPALSSKQSHSVFAMIRLSLTNHHGRDHLLPEFGLSLFDRGHDHVPHRGRRHSVQSGTKSSHGNHIQILGTSVVGAVHDSGDRQSQRDAELSSG